MSRKAKITKKNEIKQKQTQKQVVNVNINQPKTTNKKSRKSNPKSPQRPIIYSYGQPSMGNPSDNLIYSRPPQIAQIIPAMGGETSSLLPPNNTNTENILKAMKDKTNKIMKPTKTLTDSGTNEIFNMEPKKKLELKPEQLVTAPRGTKLQIPKQPPFKLTGEIVQRKNTDMQTELPKRKILSDTGPNEVFYTPSETKDYKTILNAANKEMSNLIQRIEKLSTKKRKEMKTMGTQIEPPKRKQLTDTGVDVFYNKVPKIRPHSGTQTETQTIPVKSVSSVGTEMPKTQTTSINTQTTQQKEKKLIFNPKKIEKQKQINKYKNLLPSNLLTSSRKQTNFINVQNAQPFIKSKNEQEKKDLLKEKAKSILSVSSTMPPVFKPYPKTKPHIPSLIQRNKKEKSHGKIKDKSLLNITDVNVSDKNKDALTRFTKISNMFDKSIKSDKNMNDILQGLQMQNKIPDFIKKDTGGILETPQKQEKSALKIQKVIRGNLSRKETEKMKPVELFGGTRSGAIIHPEATAPPQPLFGKDIDKSINDNFSNFKKIYDTTPKSYDDIKEAKKQMNIYKQNINRIKKRNGKSVLSPEQVQLKVDTLNEIKKLQKTYDQIYKEFYKTQQPKRGRKPKA